MKTILVPLDCSAASERVLGLAQTIARSFGAEVHLMHVREIRAGLPPYPGVTSGAGMPEMMPIGGAALDLPPEEIADPADDERHEKLVRWKINLARGLEVTLHEPTGSVVEQILKQAGAVNADLIVMGSHGHGAMYNLLVGSVTEGVLKSSTCPVLLVPSSPAAPGRDE